MLLEKFIGAELERDIAAPVRTVAEEIAAHFGDSARAVLFYGSCLRTGVWSDQILDFYVIVSNYSEAHGSWLAATANRLLPPNVYYHETAVSGELLRSKYAVLALDDFERRVTGDMLNVSVWARFSQPAALAWCPEGADRSRIRCAVAQAVTTMARMAAPAAGTTTNPKQLWTTALGLTYGAELRSEKVGKAGELFELDRARYEAVTPLLSDALAALGVSHQPSTAFRLRWMMRRLNGKMVSLARLAKAVFTFKGGIDYLAWKISRHSGVEIDITPWQRRHPILAGPGLYLRLYRLGAFR